MISWIPLRVHSQYSILDATASPKKLAKKAASFGMPSVALTDHGNLFGAVDFYQACRSEGVKPIIGCEFYEAPASRTLKKKIGDQRNGYSLVLLAKNQKGYQNLCKLSSIGYLEGFYYYPRIDQEVLQQYCEGLICIAGGTSSKIGVTALENQEQLLPTVAWYHELFGDDFYLELQRHSMSNEDLQEEGFHQESWRLQKYQDYLSRQERVNERLIEISKQQNIPLVATNDSHYLDREEWQAHEVLINVQSGEPCELCEYDTDGKLKFRRPNPKRRTYPSNEFYFKSQEQMAELFYDHPEALENTLKVAEKCSVDIDLDTRHYPVYEPPALQEKTYTDEERTHAVEEYLWQLCENGIAERYTPERLAKVQEIYPDQDPMKVVRDRLKHEMGVIAPKGICDYLLIVWDFINWAKRQGIPVGPGRGSGVGSIVLYLIGITDIEPLRFNLFFERFINPERPSYPDIDVDICMDRRSEVINYTLQKYGKENVAQIITFGTMKAKLVIRDVGRVLNIPLSKVNEIAKLVPEDPSMTLERALEIDQDFKRVTEEDEDAKRIIHLGRQLEGSIRSTGMHAAGIIVCGDTLTDHVPICVAKDSEIPVTQFSMKPVEAVGMLKIDFLGLKTLTSTQICVNAIATNHGVTIDWENLPLDDEKTFSLLNQGNTHGVFQIETGGMQELARQLHLDRFEEIIAVLSLYRPGPMDMIPSYVSRKHGREEIENDHPWMKEILSETYGIMVYQEQVMQIARRLANYSLGEGDVLRRAMGKKDKKQMEQQREKFKAGAMENGIAEETAMLIFDKMEKFASYGFNKSHAAAYGYITYVTAYLKANYPGEWMAALLTCERDDITKVGKLIGECQAMGIPILPPDVNEAGQEFVATPQGIRFAMSGIKGVGEGVVETIIKERTASGPYKNLYEFLRRLESKRIGKKVTENLIEAGGFDFIGWNRDALRNSVEEMYRSAEKERKEQEAGVLTIFEMIGDTNEKRFAKQPEVKEPSTPEQIYLKEKELLGFFLTGHPLKCCKDLLRRLSCIPLSKIHQMDDGAVFRAAFIVEEASVKIASRTQKKFAILTISDESDRFETSVWSELYAEKGTLLEDNRLLYAVLQVDKRDEGVRLTCRWLDDLAKADEEMIEACDRAYDRVKLQALRFSSPKGKKKEKEKKQKEEKKQMEKIPKKAVLSIDVTKTSLSKILNLRNTLHQHTGNIPVELHFHTDDRELGIVHIEGTHGITMSDPLQQKLEKMGVKV